MSCKFLFSSLHEFLCLKKYIWYENTNEKFQPDQKWHSPNMLWILTLMNPDNCGLLFWVTFVKKSSLWFQFMMLYMDCFIKTRKWIYFTIEINNSCYYTYYFHEAYVMLYSQFCLCKCWILHTSECRSVVSDSLWPMDCIVHGILQARILEWVAFPFSRGSSQPRNRTRVSCIGGGFFTRWVTRTATLM